MGRHKYIQYDMNDNLEEVKRNRAALNIKVWFVFY